MFDGTRLEGLRELVSLFNESKIEMVGLVRDLGFAFKSNLPLVLSLDFALSYAIR
jgi:hypothetical protein